MGFNITIADEAHYALAADSAQALYTRDILNISTMIDIVTATPYKGKSSSIFYLFWKYIDEIKRSYPYTSNQPTEFIDRNGSWKYIKINGNKHGLSNSEAPGTADGLMLMMMEYILSGRLTDLGEGALKGVTLHPHPVYMTSDMQEHINEIEKRNMQYKDNCKKKNEDWPRTAYYNQMIHAPDFTHEEMQLIHTVSEEDEFGNITKTEKVAVRHAPMRSSRMFCVPKEAEMLDLIEYYMVRGRRVILFTSNTGDKYRAIDRYIDFIGDRIGHNRVRRLPTSIPTRKRATWVRNEVENGMDVLVANQSNLTEGISLIDFSVIIYMEPDPQLIRVIQSSARTNRHQQTQHTDIHYMYYKNSPHQRRAFDSLLMKWAADNIFKGYTHEGMVNESHLAENSAQIGDELDVAKTLSHQEMVDAIAQINGDVDEEYARSPWIVPNVRKRKDWSLHSA